MVAGSLALSNPTNDPTPYVFVSYSHEDERYARRLLRELTRFERKGILRAWSDRRIPCGGHTHDTIERHLDEARLILVLVSPAYLSSDYCCELEMRPGLRKHEAGEAVLVPILLRPCDWEAEPFAHLQVIPSKPITRFSPQDKAWLEIVQAIRRAVSDLQPTEDIR